MTNFKSINFNFIFIVLLFAQACAQGQEKQQSNLVALTDIKSPSINENSKGFAVVELFTSEGCSSCPPADRLLHEIAEFATKENKNIFILSYHVDYWNRLGWTDKFSDAKYTQRQNWYADVFQNNQVYTPQMLVNGDTQFVGSQSKTAYQQIEKAISQTNSSTFALHLKADTSKGKQINYHFEGKKDDLILNYALVEKSITSNIKTGENAGVKLFHYSVVKSLKSTPLKEKGVLELDFSIKQSDLKDKFEFIAFVQDRQTGKILAANQLDF